MVRIEEDKLVIEFDCETYNPLEYLAHLQRGLIDATEVMGDKSANADQVQNAIFHINKVLRNIFIDEFQLSDIYESLTKDESAMRKFNRIKP